MTTFTESLILIGVIVTVIMFVLIAVLIILDFVDEIKSAVKKLELLNNDDDIL
jgi:hypothetical protein